MIFPLNDNFHQIESYKERNLYYKIFAGYLFNELIPGYAERKEAFFTLLTSLLDNPDRFRGSEVNIKDILAKSRKLDAHITFDYHSCQIIDEHKRDNRGEMSDVLLINGAYFISIECKYLSNLNFGKDVQEVQDRIRIVAGYLSLIPLQVILIKAAKWRESIKVQKHTGSFYTAFQNANLTCPVLVLFWEDLISLIDSAEVVKYLEKQLERKY